MVPFGDLAAYADPLPPATSILVSLYLGGGLDGAHMLVPAGSGYGAYASKRGDLAIPEANLLSLGSSQNGLNPNLPKLRARYQAGDVAFIRGTDILNPNGFDPLSHFDKTDYMSMSYSSPPPQRSGAWGRWADAQADNPLLMATVDFGLPILFQGASKVQAAALPFNASDALGANPDSDEQALIDAFLALDGDYGPADTSFPARFAHAGGFAMRTAADIGAAYPPDPDGGLRGDLQIIAALINANVTGTRVYATVQGGYDTHENQANDLDNDLFPELDDALDGFFNDVNTPQDVVVMIWTEFGRRPEANRTGTDHGRANNVVLVGPRVNGGLYGAQPSFADNALDPDGNLVGSVEIGSVVRGRDHELPRWQRHRDPRRELPDDRRRELTAAAAHRPPFGQNPPPGGRNLTKRCLGYAGRRANVGGWCARRAAARRRSARSRRARAGRSSPARGATSRGRR